MMIEQGEGEVGAVQLSVVEFQVLFGLFGCVGVVRWLVADRRMIFEGVAGVVVRRAVAEFQVLFGPFGCVGVVRWLVADRRMIFG